MSNFPLVQNDCLKPFVKILTDYPRDDLASDEVHQALITACAKRDIECFAMDVGAIPSMDTVVAGFKTAQLARNSELGYGHVLHTNCAPRRHMVSKKSQGEGIVIGMLNNGVTLVTVNSGYTLSPFFDMIEKGDAVFFTTKVPDSGSQFRSRDYFPDAMMELAVFLKGRLEELGQTTVSEMLSQNKMADILNGFSLLVAPLKSENINQNINSVVLYIDNFGNIKTNIDHKTLLDLYPAGSDLVLSIGGTICHASVGQGGFSQGEGVLALTRGSSGWGDVRFTEVFLRGGNASHMFPNIQTGERVFALPADVLKRVVTLLRDSGQTSLGTLDLYMLSEARLINILADRGLIKDGIDTTALQSHLDQGDLIDILSTPQGQAA